MSPGAGPAPPSAGRPETNSVDDPLRLGIFGRGRLGRAVAEGAAAAGHEVGWCVGRDADSSALATVDVVVDASLPEALSGHLRWAARRRVPLVIAVTGWDEDLLGDFEEDVAVVVAPNGSILLTLFEEFARRLGAFGRRHGGEGFVVEHHHRGKRDAPSGTALRLAAAFQQGGTDAESTNVAPALSIASIRAGSELGRHRLGLDLPHEVITVEHCVRSRETFADGLLLAAGWLARRARHGTPAGVFGLGDVLLATEAESRSIRPSDEGDTTPTGFSPRPRTNERRNRP